MMSARVSTFKFIDKGCRSTIVLVPGWASDYRVFDNLELDFNYLVVVDFLPDFFKKELVSSLKLHGLSRVSLIGWSLGGFAACEFSSEYSSYVEKLFLVSVRQKYEKAEIELIKERVRKNRKGYLRRFYSQCFHDPFLREYFEKEFAKRYYRDLNQECLIKGLDYLAKEAVRTEGLENLENVKIVHGEFDNIAPLEEARNIADGLPRADFIVVKGAGHMPFLRKDFPEYIK